MARSCDVAATLGFSAALPVPEQHRKRLVGLCLAVAAALAAAAPSAAAQGASSGISARLVEKGTDTPVFGARVSLVGTTKAATSDSTGHFGFDALLPGFYVLEIRAIGYARAVFQVDLGEGEVVSRVFEISPRTYGLSPLTVEAQRRAQGRRFEEFRQRMARGVGTFITADEINRRNPSSLMDMLRTVRGVHAECTGSDCIVRFSGQPTSCEPAYYVDLLPSDSRIVQSLSPRDIEGVEIYRGASELPAEFGGSEAACGVIVIWTKSGP